MKTLLKKSLAISAVTFAIPLLAFAQAITSVQTAGQFIINIINTVAVPVVFAIAFIVFIYGILQFFILGRGDEEKQALGRSFMLWGLIGFFLMVSVWGLVNIFIGSVNLQNNTPTYPQAPSSSHY